jgi:hypothetical protein
VEALAHALAAEEHHAQEPRLEEEGGEHLTGHERSDHRAGAVGEDAPVGAELVGHDDAGNHAHPEGDGEDLLPVFEEREIVRIARANPLGV